MATIATQEELERFATQDPVERHLTEPIKGVLAETALTGRNRYPFSLVKPVVELSLEQTLREYEHAQRADEGDVGPARPVLGNESLPEAIRRFRSLLQGFTKAPWTIQRLCELLLNPTRQYKKLHKLALAVEKCLMVTGEVGITPRLPPPPLLSSLLPVNDNSKCHDPQPAPHAPDRTRRASSPAGSIQDPDAEDSAAFTSALIEVRGQPPTSSIPSSNGPPHLHNNGHPGFVQFHQQHQHGNHFHHAHPPRHGPESTDEDEKWPTSGANQNHHHAGSLHHPYHVGLHNHHPQQPHGQGEVIFEAVAAAAAAAIAAEGMEIETPVGPQLRSRGEEASATAAEAAARAVLGGLDVGMPAVVSTAASSPARLSGEQPSTHMQQGSEEAAAAAAAAASHGSPAPGTQAGGQLVGVESVPATPPSAGKAPHEQLGEGQHQQEQHELQH